ncbi:GDSL-like Lipase/Acylhydrolase [Planctomycetes bacterium Poly30]|uniref:GDSL-like Lipase/Acylhydrolase n=1 Tax=Saltatorellus ferox TaxID=2528018 RepID=A0A518F0H7_9BACT|nr:GDSL-like Lipase/Acylhydrolase [Planctomycetes bacterium Poly30]
MDAPGRPFRRYIALGDSSTEGLDDPNGRGGYRGWSERLALHIARGQAAPLEYANLAVRGRSTREVLEEQLAPALALAPDFATLFVGTNDVTAGRFDEERFAADFEAMQRSLRDAGSAVLSFTLPDLTPVMPLARFVRGRVLRMNERIRGCSAATGSLLVDFAAAPVTSDPRLWSEDRIHANSLGHERMAAALAEAIGLVGHGGWEEPLGPAERRSLAARAGTELGWWTRHFVPWIGRSLTGKTSGDGLEPKYPCPIVVSD